MRTADLRFCCWWPVYAPVGIHVSAAGTVAVAVGVVIHLVQIVCGTGDTRT